MLTASAPPAPRTAVALLRARGWIVPCVLLVFVVGISIASAQRGSAVPRDDSTATVAEKAEAARAAVRCDVRHGFLPRLAITAQVMARSLVAGSGKGERVPGATCQVQQP